MPNSDNLTIALAAGGTGGHIFPAESLSVELRNRGHRAVLITDIRRKQYDFAKKNNIDIYVVKSASPGGGASGMLKALFAIFLGTIQATRLLKKIRPDVVVGFGGYPSFPTMIAAYLLHIPRIIHEQNSVLGRVNRALAPFSNKIATSFEKVSCIRNQDKKKIILTGNPVRPNIKAVRDISYPELQKDEHLHILVTGGSQGASIFSDVIPKAILSLPKKLQKRIRIDQQCRPEDIDKVREEYEQAGINADLATFFSDMSSRIAASHIIICRAGASTIAEVTVTGRPAIYIPYMHATDDHQTKNAMAVVNKGAGIITPQKILTPEVIAGYITDFIENPEILVKTALNSFEIGILNAEKRLADVVEKTAGR